MQTSFAQLSAAGRVTLNGQILAWQSRRLTGSVMPSQLLSSTKVPAVRATPKSFLSTFVSFLCVLTLVIDLPPSIDAAAKDKKAKQDSVLKGLPIKELTADEAILHALNRLAYGPRPGDIERVRQMGLAKWIDQQLNPNSIDDQSVQARLETFPTLKMSTAKLLTEYPQPKQAEKQAIKPARAEQPRSEQAAVSIAKDMPDRNTDGSAVPTPRAPDEGDMSAAAPVGVRFSRPVETGAAAPGTDDATASPMKQAS